jgi:hypothetical protein
MIIDMINSDVINHAYPSAFLVVSRTSVVFPVSFFLLPIIMAAVDVALFAVPAAPVPPPVEPALTVVACRALLKDAMDEATIDPNGVPATSHPCVKLIPKLILACHAVSS